MIVNGSRLKGFAQCREKQWNWDELRLTWFRTPDTLFRGSGFHEGIAEYFATHDISRAADTCERSMRETLAHELVLQEDLPEIEHAIAWTRMAVKEFAAHYEGQPVQVLWPEVKFQVPIPNSEHHCFFVHRLAAALGLLREDQVQHPNGKNCINTPCANQPHYFRGKTDAVVTWENNVWLFEHKTNSLAQDIFFQKFFLDSQPTGYLYGIWKSMGVLPAGFILNVIQKPNKRAKDQMQVGFAREVYLRSEEDLHDFETEVRAQATEYERAFAARALGTNPFLIYRNTESCTSYGRKCTYFDLCQRHPREALPGEFAQREDDYVNTAYYELIKQYAQKGKEAR